MSEQPLHSLILAADYRVDDVEAMWLRLKSHRSILTELSAHHVVVYSSLWEPGRVLATVGIRNPNSVREVLRSPAIFEFFDASGVDDIPAVFAGEVVEKIDLAEPPPGEHAVASVIVGVVTAVEDVPALMDKVRNFASGGDSIAQVRTGNLTCCSRQLRQLRRACHCTTSQTRDRV